MNQENRPPDKGAEYLKYKSKAFKYSYRSVLIVFFGSPLLFLSAIPALILAILSLIQFRGNFSREAVIGKRIALFGLLLSLVVLYYSIQLTPMIIEFLIM